MKRRILSMLVVLAMVLSLLPVTAAEVEPALYMRSVTGSGVELTESEEALQPFVGEVGALGLKALYYGTPDAQKRVVSVISQSDSVRFLPRRGTDGKMYFLFNADQTGTCTLQLQVEGEDTVYTCDVPFVLPEIGCYSAPQRTEENLFPDGRIPFTQGTQNTFWVLKSGGLSGAVKIEEYGSVCGLTWALVETACGTGLQVYIPETAVSENYAYCIIHVGEDSVTIYPRSDEPALYARTAYAFDGALYENLSVPERLETLDLGYYRPYVHLYYGVWGSEAPVKDGGCGEGAGMEVDVAEDIRGNRMFRMMPRREGDVYFSAWVDDVEYVCRMNAVLPNLGAYATAERSAESICLDGIVTYVPGETGEVWVLFEDGFTGNETVTLNNAPAGMTWEFRDAQVGKGLVVTWSETMEDRQYVNLTLTEVENWGRVGMTLRFHPMEEPVLWGGIGGTVSEFDGLIGVAHIWWLYYGTSDDRQPVADIESLCDAVEVRAKADDGRPIYTLYCEKPGTYPVKLWVEGQDAPVITEIRYDIPIYAFYRGPEATAETMYINNAIPYGGEACSFWMVPRYDGKLDGVELSFTRWNGEDWEAFSGFPHAVVPRTDSAEGSALRFDIPAGLTITDILRVSFVVTYEGDRVTGQGFTLIPTEEPSLLMRDAGEGTEDTDLPLRELDDLVMGWFREGYLYYGLPGGEKRVTDVRTVASANDNASVDATVTKLEDADGMPMYRIHSNNSRKDTLYLQVQVEGDPNWYNCQLQFRLPMISTYSENTRSTDTFLLDRGLYTPGKGGQFYVLRESGFFGDEEIRYTNELGLTAEYVDGGWLFTVPDTVEADCGTIIEFYGRNFGALYVQLTDNSECLRAREVGSGVLPEKLVLHYGETRTCALYYGTATDYVPVTSAKSYDEDVFTVEAKTDNIFVLTGEDADEATIRFETSTGMDIKETVEVKLPELSLYTAPKRTTANLRQNWRVEYVPDTPMALYVMQEGGFTEQAFVPDGFLPEGVTWKLYPLAEGYAVELQIPAIAAGTVTFDVEVQDPGLAMMMRHDLTLVEGEAASDVVGDLNGDDMVTARDHVLLCQELVTPDSLTKEQKRLADVSMDGNLTTVDALHLYRHLAGQESNAAKSIQPKEYDGDPAVIEVGSAAAAAGDEITIPIHITGNPGLSALALEVSWPEKVMTLTNFQSLSVLNGGYWIEDLEEGRMLWIDPREHANDGDLMELTFEIKEDASAGDYKVAISLLDGSKEALLNEDYETIPAKLVSGTVQVTAGTQVLEYKNGGWDGPVESMDHGLGAVRTFGVFQNGTQVPVNRWWTENATDADPVSVELLSDGSAAVTIHSIWYFELCLETADGTVVRLPYRDNNHQVEEIEIDGEEYHLALSYILKDGSVVTGGGFGSGGFPEAPDQPPREWTKLVTIYENYGTDKQVYAPAAVLDQIASVTFETERDLNGIFSVLQQPEKTEIGWQGVFGADWRTGDGHVAAVVTLQDGSTYRLTARGHMCAGRYTEVQSQAAQAMAGDTVVIPVMIENNTGIAGFNLQVSYNTAALKLVGIEKGEVLTRGSLSISESGDRAAWVSPLNVTEDGALLYLTFEISDACEAGTYWVNVHPADDDFGNFVDENSQQVSAVFKSSPLEVLDCLLGDINGDGEVAATDGVLLVKHLLGDLPLDSRQLRAADTTCDGKVNTADAVRLVRHLAGLVPELGAGTQAAALFTRAANTAILSVDAISAVAGQTVNVPVRISNNPGVAAFAFGLDYDREKLTFLNVLPGELMTENNLIPNPTAGEFAYLDFSAKEIMGDGVLFYLQFRVDEQVKEEDCDVGLFLRNHSAQNFSCGSGEAAAVRLEAGTVCVGEAAVSGGTVEDGVLNVEMTLPADADPTEYRAMVALYKNGRMVHTQFLQVQAGERKIELHCHGDYDSGKIFLTDQSCSPETVALELILR